jgi:hypothetical protein
MPALWTKVTIADRYRQACLGMHARIHVLQRHHQFKVNLTKLNVSDKVIENNSTIIDGSDNFHMLHQL